MRLIPSPAFLSQLVAGAPPYLAADAAFVLFALLYSSLVSRAYLASIPQPGIQVPETSLPPATLALDNLSPDFGV